jgi:hypothetical protein
MLSVGAKWLTCSICHIGCRAGNSPILFPQLAIFLHYGRPRTRSACWPEARDSPQSRYLRLPWASGRIPRSLRWPTRCYCYLSVRTTLDPYSLAAPLRASIAAGDPAQPVTDIRSMEERLELASFAAIHYLADRRHFGGRVHPGSRGDLRSHRLFGGTADAGTGHSHGAGRGET